VGYTQAQGNGDQQLFLEWDSSFSGKAHRSMSSQVSENNRIPQTAQSHPATAATEAKVLTFHTGCDLGSCGVKV